MVGRKEREEGDERKSCARFETRVIDSVGFFLHFFLVPVPLHHPRNEACIDRRSLRRDRPNEGGGKTPARGRGRRIELKSVLEGVEDVSEYCGRSWGLYVEAKKRRQGRGRRFSSTATEGNEDVKRVLSCIPT